MVTKFVIRIGSDNFRKEYEMAISKSTEDYLKKLCDKLMNPNTSQMSYWKID